MPLPHTRCRSVIGALLLASLVAGCAQLPEYQPPVPTLPARFDGAPDFNAGVVLIPTESLLRSTAVSSRWWKDFQDPILNGLVEGSLRQNFSLASAIATVEQARASAQVAGAPLFPSLTLNGSADRSHGRSGGTSKSQSVFAEASYEFDFWGLNAANANAATLLARASGYDRDTVALTLTASVVNTYFSIQGLRRRLALAQTIVDDSRHVLALLTAQQEAGVATALQVQQQRNAVATFQAAVPVLQQQLDADMHALATLSGHTPEGFAIAQIPLETTPIPQPRPGLPASLLTLRPDIRAKEAQLQAANQNVVAARAAFLPNVALVGDAGVSSNSLVRFLSNPFASIAASVAAPLFDGGALRGQLHANQAVQTKAVADYRQSILSALQDVEDALSAARQQQLAETADVEAVDAARQAATLATAQYQAGTIDFLTVLDTERTRYQAEDTLVQTRVLRLQAAVGIFRAFGGGNIGAAMVDDKNSVSEHLGDRVSAISFPDSDAL